MNNIFRAFFQMQFKLCRAGSVEYGRQKISIFRALTDMKQETLLGQEDAQVKDYKDNIFQFFELEFGQWEAWEAEKKRVRDLTKKA